MLNRNVIVFLFEVVNTAMVNWYYLLAHLDATKRQELYRLVEDYPDAVAPFCDHGEENVFSFSSLFNFMKALLFL